MDCIRCDGCGVGSILIPNCFHCRHVPGLILAMRLELLLNVLSSLPIEYGPLEMDDSRHDV